MNKTEALYIHGKERMPGGVGLLSKRPEMFAPEKWPAYAAKAEGCRITDLDGNEYIDMTTCGIGACLLGYADPHVSRAVIRCVENGTMSSLNAPEEVFLADRLCEIHPWAESVRFARTGGEICSIAVRIARATTGKDMVAISGYHGWSDWYLASNLGNDHALDGVHLPGLKPNGVPRGLAGSAVTFLNNDPAAFDRVIDEYGEKLACVIMEPMRGEIPQKGYLAHVRKRCTQKGILLIFDEITIGWRYCFGGCHLDFGVAPDIAVFAKAMGNGHPIAAVIGTREAMDGAHESFTSSTYWTEALGYAAALATIEKIEKTRVWEHVKKIGSAVQADWEELGKKHGLKLRAFGLPCLSHFSFEEHPLELKTLYSRLMLEEGFLGNTGFYPTLAHDEDILAKHREAVDRVFFNIAETLKKGGVEEVMKRIDGRLCETDFRRLIK